MTVGKAKSSQGSISSARPFIEKAKNSGIYSDDSQIGTFLKSLGE